MLSLIVPLYIYPAPGAWNPLYTAITEYPNITFLVVVNPASGPGPLPLPDTNYVREVGFLNNQANARTLGYVSTSYAKRDLDDVKADIQKYSAWHDAGLGLNGIFFDETPAEYNVDSADFLLEAQREARHAPGATAECLIVNNPGTLPDPRYLAGPNITVVFEGAYEAYQMSRMSSRIAQLRQSTVKGKGQAANGRSEFAVILHSLPPRLASNKGAISKLMAELAKVAGVFFLTDLSEGYYAGWGRSWTQVVADAGHHLTELKDA